MSPTSPPTQPAGVDAGGHIEYPDDWIPVEDRWFGIERRTIKPALIVLAFVLAMAYLVPALEAAVPYDDEVEEGDVIVLNDGVSFAPTPGWDIESGVRLGDEPTGGIVGSGATVTDGPVSFDVTVGSFDGDAVALVDQIEEATDALNDAAGLHVVGEAVTTANVDGLPGAAARFQGSDSDGLLVAFTDKGVGVQIVITGPPDFDGDEELADDIAAMIASTRIGEES